MRCCVTKLGCLSPLSEADQQDLLALGTGFKNYSRGQRVQLPSNEAATFFLSQGIAFRSVITRRGNRQIVELLLPGDIISIDAAPSGTHGFQIEPAESVRITVVRTAALEELVQRSVMLARAFTAAARVNEGALRRRIVSLGQFDAQARIAELFCDFWDRAQTAGLIVDDRVPFPLIQSDIADATGITSVHTNRVLQQMRADGMIELHSHMLRIPNPAVLGRLCEFPPPPIAIPIGEAGEDGRVSAA